MYRQSEKNLLSSNTSSTCPDNMVNFGLLTAEIGSGVWAPLQISTGIASWQCYCTASSSGRQPNFAALNRRRHLCLAGRPSGWALAHILVLIQSQLHETCSSVLFGVIIYETNDFLAGLCPLHTRSSRRQ